MVVNQRYPLTLVLKDHGADVDLKPLLESEEYEETGNEEVSNALIKLNAGKFGRFFKDNVTVGTKTWPKINFFDRIFIRFTDPDGNITEDVLEVLHISKIEMKGVGDVIEIQADTQGYHLSRMHNLKQYQRESGFDIIADNGAVYNSLDVRGTNQPTLEGHDLAFSFAGAKPFGNAASQATSIDLDFGNAEFYIQDAINASSDRYGSSVDSGGELEFFDWRTLPKYDHSTGLDIDKILMQFRVSGDIGAASKVVVDKASTAFKLLDTRGDLDPEKSTSVYAWGDINSGSNPPGFQIYFGEKEAFLAAKQWTDGIFYKSGMRVQFEGAFYVALQNHTAILATNDPITGIGFFWNVETFTPTQDYSLWTKDRPQYWINSGAGYIHQETFPAIHKAAMHDHNLVIRDVNHRRSWTDVRVISLATVPSTMYLQGGGDEMYRGFRILLDTAVAALGAPFTQNSSKDRFDKSYADATVQHNGGTFVGSNEYLNWDVFLESKNDLEIIVMRDGDSYVFNPCSSLNFSGTCLGSRTPGWNIGYYKAVQIAGVTLSTFASDSRIDCLHPYQILNGPARPDFGTTQGVEPGTPGVDSAIRVKFDLGDDIRSAGAWLNFAWPIPRDGFAGVFAATNVGEKFINPTFDFNNMHLSSLGKRGLNQGIDSEGRGALDFGKSSAIRMYLKILATTIAGLIPPGGDFKFRLSFFDTGDNVIVKDVTISHNINADEIEAEIGGFEIFRGRHGIAFTPVQELEILDIFESRNVVRMAISSMDSYDSDGRFNPFNRFTALFGTTELQIDAPHFVTPLNATTQTEILQANKPELNFERDPLDAPQISNYVQLRNHALSNLEIEQFKRVEYSITRPLRCDIKFGDEFTLKHPILVDDPDFAPNDEVDLICKKNIFTYSKGRGRGGYKTVTIGIKRFRT